MGRERGRDDRRVLDSRVLGSNFPVDVGGKKVEPALRTLVVQVQPGVDTLFRRRKQGGRGSIEFCEQKIGFPRQRMFAVSGAKGSSCTGNLGAGSYRAGRDVRVFLRWSSRSKNELIACK